jgi:hypothetical protein
MTGRVVGDGMDDALVHLGGHRVVIAAGGHRIEVETDEPLHDAAELALHLWQRTETPHLAKALSAGAIGFGSTLAIAAVDDDGGDEPDDSARRRRAVRRRR